MTPLRSQPPTGRCRPYPGPLLRCLLNRITALPRKRNPIARFEVFLREYELTVVFDLAVAEAGGNDAAPNHVDTLIAARGGKVLRHDHWGRRRMAYPINRSIDADYVVSRVEIDPTAVTPLEAAMRIDERIYRHLIVRADELPIPPPPREPRRMPSEAGEGSVPPPDTVEAASDAPVAEAAVAAPEIVDEPAEASAEPAAAEATTPATVEEPEATPEPVASAEPEVADSAPEEPAAAVESPATEAEATAEAETDDEAPSA